MNETISTITIYALPVLFAITLHEAAHAYAAKFFGDTTAYVQGRMSLNPLKHIDLFGTILIPIVLYLATSGSFLFGYAKPVPVIFTNLRHPKRDMTWVALAGPLANFIMLLVWVFALVAFDALHIQEEFFIRMARAGIWVNLLIFAFNLFPLPPLDGGRILIGLLPNALAQPFAKLEPYGFFIVLALVALNFFSYWLIPFLLVAHQVLFSFFPAIQFF